jgi:uncharacterized protein YerC
MKKRASDLSEDERIATLDALYTAAGTVRGRNAMQGFLRDLLTESERVMLGRRILIARLLLSSETHDAVRARTGAGYATIARIEHWLHDAMPGYGKAVTRPEYELHRRETVTQHARDPFASLRQKTSLRFLFSPAGRVSGARNKRAG